MTRRRRPGRAGFTLLEMMVVIMILGVLLGMSAAVFTSARSRYRYSASVAGVGAVVRGARNFAQAAQSLSAVLIEQRDGEVVVTALGQRQIASWHLEGDANEDSGGITLINGGKQAVQQGKFGRCVELREGQTLDAGPAKRFPALEGVAISAWFFGYPGGDKARQTLIDFGGDLVVRWEDDAGISATVKGEEIRTPYGVMPAERWTHVEVSYDRTRLSLFVDGVEQAGRPVSETIGGSDATFRVGDKSGGYAGLVDELSLSVYLRPESQTLPGDVQFVGGPSRLHFDRQGRLDAALHPGGAELWFLAADQGSWRRVEISPIGRVTITEHSDGPAPPKKKQPEKKQPEKKP